MFTSVGQPLTNILDAQIWLSCTVLPSCCCFAKVIFCIVVFGFVNGIVIFSNEVAHFMQKITQPFIAIDIIFNSDVKIDIFLFCFVFFLVNHPAVINPQSFKQIFCLPSGTSTATPRVLCLSSGSCSRSRSRSFGDTPVTETNLPRNFGPHQGGVSVPPDPVPQVGV